MLQELERSDEAYEHLTVALPLVEEIRSHELSANLFAAMSQVLETRGDFKSALDYQRRAETERTFESGEKAALTIAELRESFAAERRQLKIAELRRDQLKRAAELSLKDTQLRQTRNEWFGLVGVIFIGGIAVAAVISRQRARSRAERIIHEETKRSRDAAERADGLKTRLLELASHDLKGPLVGIMLTADAIVDEAFDRTEVVAQAQPVREESKRMFDLVQDLLDNSALEGGRLQLRARPLALDQLVAEWVEPWSR